MKLFLFPTERSNKITVTKGKFFDQCVGSVSADASAVCWPTRQKCIGRPISGVPINASASVLAEASVGSDSLPSPNFARFKGHQ